MMHRMIKRK